ncbi:hypothetical protein GGX14DRAFT_164275 [Mycena pura]|uniref:Protein kinase domain-containing protein n=1 Tax=Mycena pura TaxID=153505 RepID=A0AAD6YM66_9AGAR|nr:hypothetical protein GGX14DRAFT_164275 [Mycena pura]
MSRTFMSLPPLFLMACFIICVASYPQYAADFRRIPLGDLNLLCDLDYNSGVISRRQGQCSIRRVYSARIPGCESNMTVAVYQGDNADEKWREDVSKYANLRHPNIVQVYGVTICSDICATVYHDGGHRC